MAGDATNPMADGAAPEYIDVPGLAPPGGRYCHAVVGAGLVFVSGQLPVTPDGARLVDAPFEEQARQALSNVRTALQAAGSDLDRLLQVRVYVDDIEHWPAFDRMYREWVGEARPARTVVPTSGLHFGVKVEVEAIALKVAHIDSPRSF